jgi:sugar transferase (PEP-CTERM system associated)
LIRILHAYFPKRTLLLAVSEAFLISSSFAVISSARLSASRAVNNLGGPDGSFKIAVATGVFVACMYCFDLYDSCILRKRREVLIRWLQVLVSVYVLLALIQYLCPPLGLSPGTFQAGFVAVATLLVLWRELFSLVNSVPRFTERAVIVGENALVESLIHECETRPELGLRIVGRSLSADKLALWIDRTGGASSGSLPDNEFREEYSRAVEHPGVDRIVIALGECRGKLPVELLLSLKSRGVRVQDSAELYEKITGKIPIESIRMSSLLFSPGCYASRVFLMYKRAASVVVSVLGLVISLPLIPFIVLAIKLTSPGPVFYRQRRVGRSGAVFECYKFRTMWANAEADTGPTWAGDDDPRITAVGRFLRRIRADEIPQLWNVLKGDMSLVGPRPERPEFVAALSREIPYYQLRHAVRPGISGWAQIRYKYGSSVEDAREKLRYDLFYIKNMSAGLDLLILFHTVKVILWGRGAK